MFKPVVSMKNAPDCTKAGCRPFCKEKSDKPIKLQNPEKCAHAQV